MVLLFLQHQIQNMDLRRSQNLRSTDKLRNKLSSNVRLTTQMPELNGTRTVYQFPNPTPTSLLKVTKESKHSPSEKLDLKMLANTPVRLKSSAKKVTMKPPVMLQSEVRYQGIHNVIWTQKKSIEQRILQSITISFKIISYIFRISPQVHQ